VHVFTTCLITATALAMMTVPANADVITFEGYAPNGGLTFIPPDYTESGFTLSNTGQFAAAIFGDSSVGLLGDTTASLDWNGSEGSSITLTGPSPFDLLSLDLGAYSGAPNDQHTDITLTGNLFGGGTETATFSRLLSITRETVNWTGLQSVVFTATYYGGIDNIVTGGASTTPEPGTMLLLGAGIGALALVRRRNTPKPASLK
jgi:hypothetical protein